MIKNVTTSSQRNYDVTRLLLNCNNVVTDSLAVKHLQFQYLSLYKLFISKLQLQWCYLSSQHIFVITVQEAIEITFQNYFYMPCMTCNGCLTQHITHSKSCHPISLEFFACFLLSEVCFLKLKLCHSNWIGNYQALALPRLPAQADNLSQPWLPNATYINLK